MPELSKNQDKDSTNAPGHADVLIIGAGPAGGVAARRLCSSGQTVVALEQGHWQDRNEYHGTQWDWELVAGKQWNSLLDVRQSPDDYPIDLSESDMRILSFCGVGGGTILYNAVWNRLFPSNFETFSQFGFADDWPITYQDLQPFYERTDREIGVSGLGGNPLYPPGEEPPLPSLPFNPGALKIARAMAERGWHWWPDTNAILSLAYDGRHPCVQRAACAQGCSEGAKSSADVTHWRHFINDGGHLITGARVRRITLDDEGLANGAEWVDENGQVHFQSADIVLCAANGIGTARLLLASACDRYPNGLANSSGLVGKRLMLHPLALVIAYFEDIQGSFQGHYGSTVQCLEFAEHDPERKFKGGAKAALHPIGGGPQTEAIRILGGGIQDFHKRFSARFGHGLSWSIMCEDLPEEENRVVLSPTMSDNIGMAAPKLIYQTSEDSKLALELAVEQISMISREAGAFHVEGFNPAGANAHMTGTARMGIDPANSVTNPWGFTHDIPNLGIVDGSVFVTCGSVNPTSTICALALRTAEHVIEKRDTIPKPEKIERTVVDLGTINIKAYGNNAQQPGVLAAEQLAMLYEIGDRLIPAIDELPAAGQLLNETRLLDKVFSVRPDLIPAINAVLSTPLKDPGTFMTTLLAENFEAWQAIATTIAGGYYLDDRVRARIGYEGQQAIPQTPDRLPAYLDEGLLDHLLSGEWSNRKAKESLGK